MSSPESDFPAWSPAGGREEPSASHEDQPDEAQTPLTDVPLAAGTDYAGPVTPAEPGVAEEPAVIDEDVIVIATQEAAGYAGPPASNGMGAEQWREVKAMFVDDPSGSVRAASGLVEKAVEELMASVRERQESLASSWQAGDAAGTEELRNALRGYRGLFDELDQMSRQLPARQDRITGGV